MNSRLELKNTEYPNFTNGSSTRPDNGHIYLEYHRLNQSANDLSHISDPSLREVLAIEIEKRMGEILRIIKIN